MAVIRRMRAAVEWVGSFLDAFDLVNTFRWMITWAAWNAWAEMLVRAIRGEDAKASRGTVYLTSLYIALLANGSANRARETMELRGSVSEMRQLLHEAGEDAERRDERAAIMQQQLYQVTVKMAWVAGLTLLAAFVTLIVTIVK